MKIKKIMVTSIFGIVLLVSIGYKSYALPNYVYSPEVLYTGKPKVENPDTIICSGGGAKGVAYAGSLKYLSEAGKLKNVSRFMGASAGAIFSLIYYLDLKPEEANEIIENINWPSLLKSNIDLLKILDNPKEATKHFRIPIAVGDLVLTCGLASGDEIEALLRGILKDKGFTEQIDEKITFAQLKEKVEKRISDNNSVKTKDLYVVACSLVYGRTVVLSAETTPNMDVIDAVRASMAIPFVFTPVSVDSNLERVKNISGAYDVFVDGGTAYNYPIDYFDISGAKTLGFVLESKDSLINPERKKIEGWKQLFEYTAAVAGIALDNVQPSIEHNSYRTIFIDTAPIGTLTFDMTPEQRENAINKAYSATKEYFEGN